MGSVLLGWRLSPGQKARASAIQRGFFSDVMWLISPELAVIHGSEHGFQLLSSMPFLGASFLAMGKLRALRILLGLLGVLGGGPPRKPSGAMRPEETGPHSVSDRGSVQLQLLYCTVLRCTALCCAVLYCIVLCMVVSILLCVMYWALLCVVYGVQ